MKKRYTVLAGLLIVFAAAIAVRLCNLQLVNGAEYLRQSEKRLLRTMSVEAPRGEIYDRYGRAIVSNREGYSIQIQKLRGQTSGEINRIVFDLVGICWQYNVTVADSLPIAYDGSKYSFVFNEDENEPKARENAWKKKQGFDGGSDAASAYEKLKEKYGALSSGNLNLERAAVGVRYDMEQRGFSSNINFTFAKDVGIELIAAIKEQNERLPGVNVVISPIREYKNGSVAAHILGQVGSIDQEEYAALKNRGYMMNDSVGKQGLERYLEDYLRGKNGISNVEQTKDGRSINAVSQLEAEAGRNVNLTLDLELQTVAETLLSKTIKDIRANAKDISTGSAANCGAVVVVDVNSGEVLAIASYPTYDPARFNLDYAQLSRNPHKPLYNRALMGAYAPGSTYKMLTAVAALEEGAITVNEKIQDLGIYRYYKDYQPRCWIYSSQGRTHGYESVSEAIRDSCNYFFYETGRRVTIEKIEKYGALFGLGSPSGIELAGEERAGVLAGPAERKAGGGTWFPGDTLQAAIGQSDNLFTPIQLANYIAALANGGTRYRPHLVKTVGGKDGGADIEVRPSVLQKIGMSQSTHKAVTDGMRRVVTEGTSRGAFASCEVPVAAKTGSAQTGAAGNTNGVFVAYAPYDNPQIAVAAVIEKAGSGGNVAPLVRGIIESYFTGETQSDEIAPTETLTP